MPLPPPGPQDLESLVWEFVWCGWLLLPPTRLPACPPLSAKMSLVVVKRTAAQTRVLAVGIPVPKYIRSTYVARASCWSIQVRRQCLSILGRLHGSSSPGRGWQLATPGAHLVRVSMGAYSLVFPSSDQARPWHPVSQCRRQGQR